MTDYNNQKQVLDDRQSLGEAHDDKLPWGDKSFRIAFFTTLAVIVFYITIRVITTSC